MNRFVVEMVLRKKVMIKSLCFVVCLLLSTLAYSQEFPDFSGTYRSSRISYYDFLDAEENYHQEITYRILVILGEDATGMVIAVNPSTPDRPMAFEILDFIHQIDLQPAYDLAPYFFEAEATVLEKAVELGFYYNKEGKFKMLINTDESSSAFHDLERWDDREFWGNFSKIFIS